MAGPGDEMAAAAGRDHGQFRASQADREQVIEVLKTAFVAERLTKDEFDLRVDQALASRTYAELAAVTADIPVGPAAAEPTAAGPRGTPARTLAKAALRSGVCMLVAFAIVGVVALINSESLVPLALLSGVAAVIAASGILGYGVVDAWQEHRSRRQVPPRPGRNGRGLESGRPGSTGHDPALPGARPDQTRADLRTFRSRPGSSHSCWRGALAPRGMQPLPDTG